MYSAGSRKRRGKSGAELEHYRKLQKNEELLDFHSRCAGKSGIGNEQREQAERLLDDAFSTLDAHLACHRWLAGDSFSLADITWLPIQYTLQHSGYSFDRHANVKRWAAEIATRQSFRSAVVAWFEGPPGSRDTP
jgi:glutathione S-transferase